MRDGNITHHTQSSEKVNHLNYSEKFNVRTGKGKQPSVHIFYVEGRVRNARRNARRNERRNARRNAKRRQRVCAGRALFRDGLFT
jgi:hypothetical protein